MAVKCNITKYTLQKLHSLQWGGNPPKEADLAIYENYIEFLGCTALTHIPCYTEPCISGPGTHTCNITISSLKATVSGRIYTITPVGVTGIDNPPINYEWEYDTNKWELIGPNNTATLVLRLKDSVNQTTTSTPIKLVISDIDSCEGEVECGLSQGQFTCEVICPSVNGLEIEEEVTCYGVIGLIVNYNKE